jgi:hypothetical protein
LNGNANTFSKKYNSIPKIIQKHHEYNINWNKKIKGTGISSTEKIDTIDEYGIHHTEYDIEKIESLHNRRMM